MEMTPENKGYAFSADDNRVTDAMRAALDTLRDEVLVVSTDYQVLLANARVRERIGDIDPVERHWYCHDVHARRRYPCGREDHPCIVQEVVRTGEIVHSNHLVIDDFGHSILMEAAGTPIRNETGEIIWIVQTLREIEDTTSTSPPAPLFGDPGEPGERPPFPVASLGEESNITQIDHVHNVESLGALTERIAHDFNNLMVGVLGNAEFLLETVPVDSPIRDCLTDIFEAARKAAELAKQMVSYTGKHGFSVSPIKVDEIFDDMHHPLDKGVPTHIVFRYDMEPELPTIDGDVIQLRRAVQNLVTNAREAVGSAPGVIRISTGRMRCDGANAVGTHSGDEIKKGDYVFIEVSDTGTGMDPNLMKRIFDPRFTTKGKGRGLGLAAVLGIVRNLNGAIEIFSNPGEGSTFRLLFPVGSVDAPARPIGVAWSESPFEGKKALLVDDEDAIREVAKYMLDHLGFEVITATSGEEALRILQEQNVYDLVLLDFTMPGMDGEACFRAIRKLHPTQKVVLSSGHSEQEMTTRFSKCNLSGYIQKPYRLEQLRVVLQQALYTP